MITASIFVDLILANAEKKKVGDISKMKLEIQYVKTTVFTEAVMIDLTTDVDQQLPVIYFISCV